MTRMCLLLVLLFGWEAQADDDLATRVCLVPTLPARVSLLDEERQAAGEDRDQVRRLYAAQAVLEALETVGRADAGTCQAYLGPALGEDTVARDFAIQAARKGGALDAQGRPFLPAVEVDSAEYMPPPVDPTTPRGQAVSHYGELVANLTRCVIVRERSTPVLGPSGILSAPLPPTVRASWAVEVGDRMVAPDRFNRWSARAMNAGALPIPRDIPGRGARTLFISVAARERDRAHTQAATLHWNDWLRGQLDLTKDDVFFHDFASDFTGVDTIPDADAKRRLLTPWSAEDTKALLDLPRCP